MAWPLWLVAIVIIVAGIIFLIVASVAVFFIYRRAKHPISCVVWEYDKSSNKLRETYDKAGIFTKAGMKLFYLLKGKAGLNPDNTTYMENSKGKRIAYLFKLGSKNYRFINPHFKSNPGFALTVGEEDLNWAISDYNRHKNVIEGKNLLMQILPWVGIFFVGMVFFILIVYIIQKFDVLADTAGSINTAADSLRQAAEALKETQRMQVIQT